MRPASSLVACGFTWLAFASLAVAQALPPTAAPEEPTRGGIEEIIVTAERREQNLQDVAQTITAFRAEDLEKANIQDAYDLQLKVPGLVATGGLPAITLRGLGQDSDVLGPGIDPGFQLHINDIYVAQLAIALLGFVDLESAEVLAGPQGTGFGRNSTGGSMNLRTKRPLLEEYELGADFDFAQWSNYRIGTTLNVPIVPGEFAARLAYRREIPSNYYDISGQNGHKQHLTNNALSGGHYIRASLRWAPTEELTLDLIGSYSIDKDDGGSPRPLGPYPSFNAAAGQQTVFFGTVNPTGATPNSDDPNEIRSNREQFQEYKTGWAQAIVEWNVASHVIKLNGNYQYWEFAIDRDQDFTDIDAWRLVLLDTHKTWGGEATIRSDYEDSKWNWVFGANYQDDKAPETVVPLWYYQAQSDLAGFAVFDLTNPQGPTSATTALCGGSCLFPAGGGDPDHPIILFEGDTDTKTAGVFADAGYDILPELRLQAGVRYSWTERLMRDTGYLDILLEAGDVLPGAGFGLVSVPLAFCPFLGLPPAALPFCGLQDQTATPLTPANTAFLLHVAGQRKAKEWDSVTGRIRLEWRPNDESLIYLGYSRGERHGGFNWFQAASFDSETINAGELGAKLTLLDGRLLLNPSVFFYDFRNRFITNVTNNVTTTINAPKAEIYGIELQWILQPVDRLQISGNAGFLHAEITSNMLSQDNSASAANPTNFCPGNPVGQQHGPGPNCLGATPQNLKGNVLPRSPKFSASISASYAFEFSAGTLTPRLDFSYRGAQYFRQYENPLDRQAGYTRTDLRVRYDWASQPFWLEAYIQNLEDNQKIKTQVETNLNWMRYYWLAAPRTVGIRMGFKFTGASAGDLWPF
jgi:iron complex outermembrane receptor protein